MVDCKPLNLEDYRNLIHLDEEFNVKEPISENLEDRLEIVEDLLVFLQNESNTKDIFTDMKSKKLSYEEKRDLLCSYLTIRPPEPIPNWFNTKLDKLLLQEKLEKKIIENEHLSLIKNQFPETNYGAATQCSLWKGDITTLQVDAIVNAANKALLGCFRPHHKCIDNAIHSAAGPRVRQDCDKIVTKQGCSEETGWAKITRGYNLPSRYILHTVGPIHDKNKSEVTHKEEEELASCYISCLKLASKIENIKSIAFCSVSTGIFGFPIEKAAKIAIEKINEWLFNNPRTFSLIIFNVFSDRDYKIYENLLKK